MLAAGLVDGQRTASPVCRVRRMVTSGGISLGLGFDFQSWRN